MNGSTLYWIIAGTFILIVNIAVFSTLLIRWIFEIPKIIKILEGIESKLPEKNKETQP